jgi:CheY-like chemotaxis protein
MSEPARNLDDLFTLLSHELRNPIGSLRNALEVLRRDADDRELRRRMYALAQRQVDQLSRVVDDLVDASQAEHGRLALERAPIDLVAVVREAVASQTAALDSAGVQLRVELPPSGVPVWGDRGRIIQMVANLLANAAKYSIPHGTVRVALVAEAESDDAVLTVADDGVGISHDLLPLVFEPFAQGDTTLAQPHGGLGLGLALVRAIAEAHGGTADAASDGAGRGSEFRVRLPLGRDGDGKSVQEGRTYRGERNLRALRAAHGNDTGDRKVLLIDDHRDSLEGMRELLTLCGYEVEMAEDGHSGLDRARRDRPDVVICDIGLPGIDGFQVARQLRSDARTATTLLIALSGYSDAKNVRLARDAGFDRHLVKPVDVRELKRLIDGAPRV